MNKEFSVALVGASGVVGTKIIKLLEKRLFPVGKFIPLGNSTVGSSIEFNNKKYLIESLENFDPQTAQIIIFSAGSTVAEKYARDFVAAGSFVVDLSSNFRYQDDVPLIIPEINGNIIESLSKPSLIANPNCSTAQLLMALKPIHDNAKIKFVDFDITKNLTLPFLKFFTNFTILKPRFQKKITEKKLKIYNICQV